MLSKDKNGRSYKQLTFPEPTTVTRKNVDGTEEKIRYGYYESVLIVKENNRPVTATITLEVSPKPVTEVECLDGSKLFFDPPFYTISGEEIPI